MVNIGSNGGGGDGGDSSSGGGDDGATFPGSENFQYDVGGGDGTTDGGGSDTSGGASGGTGPGGSRNIGQIQEGQQNTGSDGGGDRTGPGGQQNIDQIRSGQQDTTQDTAGQTGGAGTGPGGQQNIGQIQDQQPSGGAQDQTIGGGQQTPTRPQPGASAGGTPGDVLGTSVERSGLVTTEVGASSAQLQQQAADFEAEILADRPGLTADQIDVNLTRVDGEYRFSAEFGDEYIERQVEGRAIDQAEEMDREVALANRTVSGRREAAAREAQTEMGERVGTTIQDLGAGLVGSGTSAVGGIVDLFDVDGQETVGDLQVPEQQAGTAALGQQTVDTTPSNPEIAAELEGDSGGIFAALESSAQPILGPPGTLESEAGYAVADPIGSITGAPGSIEAGAGDLAFGVRDVSAGAVETVGPPVADFLGDAVEFGSRGMVLADPMAPTGETGEEDRTQYVQSALDAQRAPSDELTKTTFAERLGEGIARGGVEATVGLPAGAVDLGALSADAGEFTAREIETEGVVEGGASSAIAGGEFAYEAGETVARQAVENPAFFTGMIAGGAVGGAASTPFRLSRLDVPEGGGGTTAVRGLRIREPAIVRPLTGRQRGRTIAGARGYRPTLGAPSLRNVDVDYTGLGSTGTATAEAMSSFEADIFRSTAADIGGQSRQQFSAAESIMRQSSRESGAEFQFDTAEEALGQARAVPESAVPDVADALRDLDATVFGSVATRARVEGFRQPRDIDITVPDEAAARTRLAESLEGEQATVSDVFDIKTEAKAPGRAFGGEEIKYGFESMEPQELGGIRFNPAEEELIRKAGASAFIRGRGAAGTPELDVGPEPRRPGRADVREKDVTDTAAIANELLGEGASAEFETAFGLTPGEPSTGLFTAGREAAGDLTVPDSLRAFREDTRAQLGAGRARTQPDAPERQQAVDVQETATDVTEQVTSPATSPGGAGTPVAGGAFGTFESPNVDLDADSPSPTPRQPAGGDVFAPSPDISPDAGGGTVGTIFGGSPTAAGDTTEATTPSPGGGPTGPTGLFTGGPTDSPPTTTTSPPFTPTTSPPTGGPPVSPPFGGPPTTAPPFISPPTGGPPDQPATRTVTFERGDEGEDETPFRPEAPTGEEFVNPVATGQQFLFGDFGGGQSSSNGNSGNGQNGNGGDPLDLFTG